MQIQTVHSYRAQLIPAGINPDEIEQAADKRLLPEIRVKAPNSSYAEKSAAALMGMPVHSIERIDA